MFLVLQLADTKIPCSRVSTFPHASDDRSSGGPRVPSNLLNCPVLRRTLSPLSNIRTSKHPRPFLSIIIPSESLSLATSNPSNVRKAPNGEQNSTDWDLDILILELQHSLPVPGAVPNPREPFNQPGSIVYYVRAVTPS